MFFHFSSYFDSACIEMFFSLFEMHRLIWGSNSIWTFPYIYVNVEIYILLGLLRNLNYGFTGKTNRIFKLHVFNITIFAGLPSFFEKTAVLKYEGSSGNVNIWFCGRNPISVYSYIWHIRDHQILVALINAKKEKENKNTKLKGFFCSHAKDTIQFIWYNGLYSSCPAKIFSSEINGDRFICKNGGRMMHQEINIQNKILPPITYSKLVHFVK